MKKTKILVPAAGLLLLSTAASVTGTVAWFAMNSSVSANGMQVKAKTNNTYLLISATNTTASTIQSGALTTVSLTVNEELYPAAPALSAAEAGYLTVAEGHNTTTGSAITTAGVQVDDATKAAAVTNWYTATATGPTTHAINTSSAKQLAAFTDYVFIQNFYLTVAAGSNGANYLTITPTITQVSDGNDVDAIKFLVVTSDDGYAPISTANNGNAVDIKGSNTTLTDSTVLSVSLYIYVDGNDDAIATNNSANLKGATISVVFDATAVA